MCVPALNAKHPKNMWSTSCDVTHTSTNTHIWYDDVPQCHMWLMAYAKIEERPLKVRAKHYVVALNQNIGMLLRSYIHNAHIYCMIVLFFVKYTKLNSLAIYTHVNAIVSLINFKHI